MTLTDLQKNVAYKYLRRAIDELGDKIEWEDDADAWNELDMDSGLLNEVLDELAKP